MPPPLPQRRLPRRREAVLALRLIGVLMLAMIMPVLFTAAGTAINWIIYEPPEQLAANTSPDFLHSLARMTAAGLKDSLSLNGLPFFVPALLGTAWCAAGWVLMSCRGRLFWSALRRFPP